MLYPSDSSNTEAWAHADVEQHRRLREKAEGEFRMLLAAYHAQQTRYAVMCEKISAEFKADPVHLGASFVGATACADAIRSDNVRELRRKR